MAPHPIWTRNLVESSLELAETSGKTFFRKTETPTSRLSKFENSDLFKFRFENHGKSAFELVLEYGAIMRPITIRTH